MSDTQNQAAQSQDELDDLQARMPSNRDCFYCGVNIPMGRLEVLPETYKCVRCAGRYPEPNRHDPNEICAKASEGGQNGFSRKS